MIPDSREQLLSQFAGDLGVGLPSEQPSRAAELQHVVNAIHHPSMDLSGVAITLASAMVRRPIVVLERGSMQQPHHVRLRLAVLEAFFGSPAIFVYYARGHYEWLRGRCTFELQVYKMLFSILRLLQT